MSRVTTCPYCHREVGLINDRPTPRSRPRGPRMSPHAAVDRTSTDRGRRPKCVPGSGLSIDAADVREVADRPSRRRATVFA